MPTATKPKPIATKSIECEICETTLATGDTAICSICSAVIGPCCTSTLTTDKPVCVECEDAITDEEIEIEEEEDDEEDDDDDDDDDDIDIEEDEEDEEDDDDSDDDED